MYNIKLMVKNPYAHLMIFRVCLFFWVFIWFNFQSLLPLMMLWYSMVFIDRKFYLNTLKYFQLPLLWLIMFFNYIVNIQQLMYDIFGERAYEGEWTNRYGVWKYDVPFPHLLLQIFTLFYGSLV